MEMEVSLTISHFLGTIFLLWGCLTSLVGFVPTLILPCSSVFGSYLEKICSFLKGKQNGLYQRKCRDCGGLGGGEEWETVVRIY